jgi:hypothetical protein
MQFALLTGQTRRSFERAVATDHGLFLLTQTLLPEISREFLARMAEGQAITKVRAAVNNGGGFRYEIAY